MNDMCMKKMDKRNSSHSRLGDVMTAILGRTQFRNTVADHYPLQIPNPLHAASKTLYSDDGDGQSCAPLPCENKQIESSSDSNHTNAALLLDSVLDLLVPCKGIGSAEGFIIVAKFTAGFLAVGVVNGVLMASKIVGSREDCVAWLSGCWVDSRTLVRTGLVGPRNVSRRHSMR